MVGNTPTPRDKFIAGIERQVALAQNSEYTYPAASGKLVKPVKWWVESGEKLLIHPRYGIARIKGATILTCVAADLLKTLKALLAAAKAGEYDVALGMPAPEAGPASEIKPESKESKKKTAKPKKAQKKKDEKKPKKDKKSKKKKSDGKKTKKDKKAKKDGKKKKSKKK